MSPQMAPLPAPGHMGVDYEQRVDFDRLRRYRLARAKASLESSECGAFLLFDFYNIRYTTQTWIGGALGDKMTRYALLTRDHGPTLWDFGSAARHHRLHSPWLEQEDCRAGMLGLRGAIGPNPPASESDLTTGQRCGTSGRPPVITGCTHRGSSRRTAGPGCWACGGRSRRPLASWSQRSGRSRACWRRPVWSARLSAWTSSSLRSCSRCSARACVWSTHSSSCWTPGRSSPATRSCCSTRPPPWSTVSTRTLSKR